jgi:TolB protein
MLLRFYRITDKAGVALLKVGMVVGDALFGGAGSLWGAVRFVVLAILTALVALVGGVLGLLWRVVKGVVGAVRWLLGGLWKALRWLLARLGKLVSAGARRARGSVIATPTGSLPRTRTATGAVMPRRARVEPLEEKLAEDPLKVQNRRLSALVIVLGVLMVGALLWATDPSRQQPIVPAVAGGGALLLNDTPPPTTDGANLSAGIVATPIPIATPIPQALREGGTLAYTLREAGQTDIWLVGVGGRTPIRITNDASDERSPSWNSDGTRLAYASRRTGNWELFVYDLATQQNAQITFDLSFQDNPRWSPDGLFIAYESYQGGNLDIYAVPVDGSEQAIRITDHPAPDFAPTWSPDGRKIAFVSWRDGNQDIYVFDLGTFETVNITQTAQRNEDFPAWSPDGRYIAYSAVEQGSEKVFVQQVAPDFAPPTVVSFGRTPSWSPTGASLTFAVDAQEGDQTYLYVLPFGREDAVATEIVAVPYGARSPVWSSQTIPPSLLNAGGLPLGVPAVLYNEQFDRNPSGAPYGLRALPSVNAPRAVLSDLVNDSFNALRARVLEVSGVDFLATLDDAWWDLERRPSPGEERRSWHMTGRAFALLRSGILGFPPQIEVVREQDGVNTFWRVYLRVDERSQVGQLGEPLRTKPWDFLAATSGDVEAFNNGGRLRDDIPQGYYVDLTRLAQDYGWERLPAGSDWQANVATRNYWLFVKRDGRDWLTAMREIYTDGELVNFLPRGS